MVAQNRRAFRDYFVEDRVEAGIVLVGSEVKSLRDGKIQLSDSYALIENGEVFLENCHIAEFRNAGPHFNHEPVRRRKLLLHAAEINRLYIKVEQRGRTLIPLKVYFKHGKVKVEIGVCTGKRKYDKREDIKRRDEDRLAERDFKNY